METPSLKNPDIFPTSEVLKNALEVSYPAFEKLMEIIASESYGLVPQWNYYKDGKAWLCKVTFKKKTVFWLSVWDGFFRTGFYFTEKNSAGITGLEIAESIKENFSRNKHIGKLIPLGIQINSKDQIADILKIIEYKKSLK